MCGLLSVATAISKFSGCAKYESVSFLLELAARTLLRASSRMCGLSSVAIAISKFSGCAKYEFLCRPYNWINNSIQFRRQVSGIMNHTKEMMTSICTWRFWLYLKPYRRIHFYYVVYK